MKRTFTLLTVLVLLTICIFAQEHSTNRNKQPAGGIRKSSFESPGGKTDRNPLQEVNNFKRQNRNLKSAEAIKQRLDSYSAQAYDALSAQWIPDERSDFIYDANQKLSLEYDYEWDNSISQLVKRWKNEISYDANGNLIQELSSELNNVDNQYYATSKAIHTFNATGNQVQEIYYEYDAISSQFKVIEKYDYTYDASGNKTQVIVYYLDPTNVLVASSKWELAYDAIGHETKKIYSYWDGTSWIQHLKYESTYNSNGNKTLYTESNWITESGKWDDPTGKTDYSYNANGKLTQESRSTKGSNNQWVPYSEDDYTFDANGNNIQYISYNGWDETTGIWTDVWKSEFTFNNNYTFNDLVLPFYEDLDIFTHMLTDIKEYSWDVSTLTWTMDYQTNLVYSEQNFTSVNRYGKDVIKVYPNPFAESVTINAPGSSSKITIDLFDQQGRKVLTKQITSDEKLSLEGYSKGIYLYKLNIDGKIQSGKLVKE